MHASFVWRLYVSKAALADDDAASLDNLLKVDHFGDAILDDSAIALSLRINADFCRNNVDDLSDDDANPTASPATA